MPSAPTTSLDLSDPAFLADPYPALARERARHPVAWHEPSQTWLTFTHATVGQVQRDRRLGRRWVDREPRDALEPFNLLHRHQMMEHEPPTHTRLRRPVASAFSRGHVERLRPRVREVAAGLLEEAGPDRFDLVTAYAEPLPVLVIAELLGVPRAHVGDLRRWSQAIVRMYEVDPGPAVVDAAVSASVDFAALVRDLAAHRRRRPAADLVSDLVATELSQDEVVAAVVLLLNAGHEASVNVLGNGLVAALDPTTLDSTAPDPTAPASQGRTLEQALAGAPVALAVEELLRVDAALQLFVRTASEPVRLGEGPGSVVVGRGERVCALPGAANRDPAVFADPDTFVPGRDPNPHLSFGVGVHFCLGAPLARAELAEALAVLRERRPGLHLAGERVRRGTFVLRGHTRVPVAG
ncbi:cytochrome P450 [Nocardioides bruguierae]|uniref:cytochrome P450 n=1 Tax=Nocardioides bruguierae TaxID=2945102 RepID=UPI00202074E1|nr:cytochrome P450 [Nocardioides bruguierae]MCL8025214.1 cytochrome P450 [Nocardioides bruguierae]